MSLKAAAQQHIYPRNTRSRQPHRAAAVPAAARHHAAAEPADNTHNPPHAATRLWPVTLLLAASLIIPGSLDFGAAQAKVPPTSVAGQNVGLLTNAEIDKKRKKAGFTRAHDGRVGLLNKYSRQWVDVKADLQVPGLLLLREADGQVYYLGYAGLKQVDLADDMVVAAVAGDDWENNMKLVQVEAEGGGVEALEMTREGFYQLVSLVSEEDWGAAAAAAAAEEPAAAAAKAAKAAGKQQ